MHALQLFVAQPIDDSVSQIINDIIKSECECVIKKMRRRVNIKVMTSMYGRHSDSWSDDFLFTIKTKIYLTGISVFVDVIISTEWYHSFR